jgi:hypothetical protein
MREAIGDDRRELVLELCQLRSQRSAGSLLADMNAVSEDAFAALAPEIRGVGLDYCLLGMGHAPPSPYAAETDSTSARAGTGGAQTCSSARRAVQSDSST